MNSATTAQPIGGYADRYQSGPGSQMQRFENILFIYDPVSSARSAFQRAISLAQTNSAKLTAISVFREIPRSLANVRQAFLEIQQAELNNFVDKFATDGISVSTRTVLGTPFLEIIREVAHKRHDLVIKSAEGSRDVADLLFGSTDLHLLRKCPCPVWIVKPSKKKLYSRILAAVDPDPKEKSNTELNKLILDLATALAARENSDLHIVHAWHLPHESTLRSGRGGLPKRDIDRMARHIRGTHKQWLDALVSAYDLGNILAQTHLLKGEAGRVIPTFAKKRQVELIVMGTVARTGIPGFFIGNTAEKTLNAVDCSVLAVKPGAFKTPVKI